MACPVQEYPEFLACSGGSGTSGLICATSLPLELWASKLSERFKDLSSNICSFHSSQYLVVQQLSLHNHPPAGLLPRARILVAKNGNYDLQVLLRTIEKGNIQSEDELCDIAAKICGSSPYKFCPGLDRNVYQDNYADIMRYDSKSVRLLTEPFIRVESHQCVMWHKLAKNASIFEKDQSEVLCQPCKRMRSHLDQRVREILKVTPKEKAARLEVSSRCPLSAISPASQKKRKAKLLKERNQFKKKLEHMDISLEDEQSDEMASIVSIMNEETHSDALNEVIDGAGCQNKSEVIRELWKRDCKAAQNQFKKDQASNALAVFTRSPAAYEALKSFHLLQLPSRATLQAYTGAFLDDPGACEKRIREAADQYKIFKEQHVLQSKPFPESDGVLIFDEVRVISRLMWNSRSEKVVGFAMTHEDMANLLDVYRTLDADVSTQSTSYILQFLWRDLTSSFDIVGPYYTSSGAFESKFILGVVMETIKLYFLYGFNTSLLVCDGASPNLATIKTTMGVSGVFSRDQSLSDPDSISPSFVNPFNPSRSVYWLICPSHQLKNMVNALFSSRPDGTKQFMIEGVEFGWQAITDMYSRECDRKKNSVARMIPQLREVHVLRDAWTKLNVHPAKIMQQEEVMTELNSYIQSNPPPFDTPMVKATLMYLTACNQLFEKGFLSHDKVSGADTKVLDSIKKGFSFFSSWLKSLLDEDPAFNICDSRQKNFMAWQTWDLLKIDVYGFTSFCEDYFVQHPHHFVSPLRVSGSAVETLFGQYKFAAGGKLDASNYATARAACLVRNIVTPHHSGKDYRDVALNSVSTSLEKKKYNHSTKS